jgi:murein DD-endopeptidase MepM/ murein hydrolase activator NlpD
VPYHEPMRTLLALTLVLLVLTGGVYLAAGRASGPEITVDQPVRLVGQDTPLNVGVRTPDGNLTRLDVVIEQGEGRFPLFSMTSPAQPDGAPEGSPPEGATLKQEAEDLIRLTGSVGRRRIPELRNGPARIVVNAERAVLFGLRHVESHATHDVTVRLTPPVVSVVSLHHFVNHGGSEVVLYRVTPADAESGVRVGDLTYPGYSAGAAGVRDADPSLKVGFFALLWDQDLNTPISVFARDEAGNEARAAFSYRVFPKPFRKSRIEITDPLLQRIVPSILEQTPELDADPDDLLGAFLQINGPLRHMNADTIQAQAGKTSPSLQWEGPFLQLANTQVEAAFADQRTYFYRGQEIDRQVHLGYDLASLANAPVQASNRGTVVYADYLGIYGNCVILDHGMGLQSLYAHLSAIEVTPGDTVQKGGQLGRTGMTGLAGGDHLHFTMLLNGQAVTPVDWWSRQWVEDRILRKLREAGAAVNPAAVTP